MVESGWRLQVASSFSNGQVSFRWCWWVNLGKEMEQKKAEFAKLIYGFWSSLWVKSKLTNQGKWSSIYRKIMEVMVRVNSDLERLNKVGISYHVIRMRMGVKCMKLAWNQDILHLLPRILQWQTSLRMCWWSQVKIWLILGFWSCVNVESMVPCLSLGQMQSTMAFYDFLCTIKVY